MAAARQNLKSYQKDYEKGEEQRAKNLILRGNNTEDVVEEVLREIRIPGENIIPLFRKVTLSIKEKTIWPPIKVFLISEYNN